MLNALVDARFYISLKEAKEDTPEVEFCIRNDADARFRVTHMLSLTEWVCQIERCHAANGPPKTTAQIPPYEYVRLGGGTICAIRAKLWDRDTARLLLGLEVITC